MLTGSRDDAGQRTERGGDDVGSQRRRRPSDVDMYSKDRGAYPATGCARAVTRRAGAAVRARTGAPRTAERVEAMDCIVRTLCAAGSVTHADRKYHFVQEAEHYVFAGFYEFTRARPGSRQLHLLSSWQRTGVNTTPPGCSSTSAAQVQSAGATPPPAPTPKQSSTLSLLLSHESQIISPHLLCSTAVPSASSGSLHAGATA